MADQLSGVAIIICIAFGVLTFLLLFIFANRQIKRFSLKSRSGPHAPTAADAAKAMQLEIDRRLDVVKCISYQPKLLKKDDIVTETDSEAVNFLPIHLYRMKVLDSLSTLEACIMSLDPTIGRLFTRDLRLCLVRLFQKGLLHHAEISIIHRFADLYEFARHEPGEFTSENFVQFMEIFSEVQQSISPTQHRLQTRNNKHFDTSSSASAETGKNLPNGKLSTLPGRVSPETDSTEGKLSTLPGRVSPETDSTEGKLSTLPGRESPDTDSTDRNLSTLPGRASPETDSAEEKKVTYETSV